MTSSSSSSSTIPPTKVYIVMEEDDDEWIETDLIVFSTREKAEARRMDLIDKARDAYFLRLKSWKEPGHEAYINRSEDDGLFLWINSHHCRSMKGMSDAERAQRIWNAWDGNTRLSNEDMSFLRSAFFPRTEDYTVIERIVQ